MFSFLRSKKRLKERPFPPAWLKVLEHDVPLYGRLSAADQAELRGHMQVFLAEKQFEGCNGQEVTDAVRLTIAGQACLLLLHRPARCFPAISSIVVYPDEYIAPWQDMDESGIVVEGEECRSGEYVADGALVLVGGVLLMTPGFFTDFLGIFFLIPFTRSFIKLWLGLWLQKRLARGAFVVRRKF